MAISHTLYLNICYFLYALFPLGIYMLTYSYNKGGFILGYWIVVAGYMVIPYYFFFGGIVALDYVEPLKKLLIILLGVILTLGLEFLMTYLVYKKIEFHQPIPIHKPIAIMGLIQIIAFEELIFRGILWVLVLEYSHSYLLTILITACCYSLNHYFLGRWSCIMKFIWGIIFGFVLFHTNNIVVVGMIHLCNNLIIVFLDNHMKTINNHQGA